MQTEHRLLFELVPEVTWAIDMRVYRGRRADREFSGPGHERRLRPVAVLVPAASPRSDTNRA